MALRLREVEPREYIYLCTPTGNELPAMQDHWRNLEDRLGQDILHLTKGTLFGLIIDQKMIPNWRARFCTRLLKIAPFKTYLLQNMPAVGYVGLRADEAEREGISYTEPEIQEGLQQRYPLSEWGWGLKDVMEYLNSQQITIPERTDCAVCFWQRLGEWWKLWRDHPEEYDKGVVVEESLGHTFRSEGRDTWPASLKCLRERFDNGEVPPGSKVMDDLFQEKDRMADMKCKMCSM